MIVGCNTQPAWPVAGVAKTDIKSGQSQPIRVVATVGMVADIVSELGGRRVRVPQLMGPGVDRHVYKGTRDDVRFILAADVVFYSGLMLEGKLADTLEKVSRKKPVVAITRELDH